MTFASPLWFWTLALLLPAALMRVWGGMEGRDAVSLLVSPRLREDLVTGGARRGARWLRFSLLAAAFTGLVVALARPQWGEITQDVRGEGRSVMLAIDTSRSMLAADPKPDRMTRAKFAAQDLVDALPGDHIGLMAFAGTAFVQVPLTTDREALGEAIDQLDTYSIARGGTNLASAIKLASSSFEDSGASQNALILFTDGEELEGEAIEEAKKAAKNGTVIIAIGVGSAEGSIIPDPDSREPGGSFVRDDSGKVVRSSLDSRTLEKIARATDGIFLRLDANAMNSDLIRSALSRLDTTETEGGKKTVPIERYQWPLGAALLLLATALLSRLWQRRPAGSPSRPAKATAALASLALFATALESDGGAASEAQQLYSEGKFEQAAERYGEAASEARSRDNAARLLLGAGCSAYQSGDHKAALEAFGRALLSDNVHIQEDSHYSLGNTLYRAGEAHLEPGAAAGESAAEPAAAAADPAAIKAALRDWYGAVDHYESALELNPENADAAHNLDVVKRRIEELEKQQQEQQQEQDQQQQENQDEQQQQQEEQQENQDEQQPQDQGEDQPQQQPGSGDDTPPQQDGDPSGDESKEGEASEGEQREAEDAQSAQDPEREVNEETGYSKEQARRQLEALADEQLDLNPIRRRTRARFFKDW